MSGKAERLENIRTISQDYFTVRDELEGLRSMLLDAVLETTDLDGTTQQEIADLCDHATEDHPDHQFHRTRIQQFLREARRNAKAQVT